MFLCQVCCSHLSREVQVNVQMVIVHSAAQFKQTHPQMDNYIEYIVIHRIHRIHNYIVKHTHTHTNCSRCAYIQVLTRTHSQIKVKGWWWCRAVYSRTYKLTRQVRSEKSRDSRPLTHCQPMTNRLTCSTRRQSVQRPARRVRDKNNMSDESNILDDTVLFRNSSIHPGF